jgi:hypothetical protein
VDLTGPQIEVLLEACGALGGELAGREQQLRWDRRAARTARVLAAAESKLHGAIAGNDGGKR